MKKLNIRIDDYEKLRESDEETKKNAFKQIILDANKRYSNNLSEHAVIDGHVLNIKEGEIFKVMNDEEVELFSAVIYLYSETKDIMNRIKKDVFKRDRALFNTVSKKDNDKIILNNYAKQLEESIEEECSKRNVLFYKISHFDNKTQDSISTFSKIHEKVLKEKRETQVK
jgi:hypothetical protein